MGSSPDHHQPDKPTLSGALALRHNGRDLTRPLTILSLLMKPTFRYFDGALGWGRSMRSSDIRFLLVNNSLIVAALVAAAFRQPGLYATFFAISVAMQIAHLKRRL